MPEFDVVVLGGGTAGQWVAQEVAQAGRAVALAEPGLVGGESPYLACLPSASLLQSARRGASWEHAVARRDEAAARLDDAAAAARLAEAGVTLVRGAGRIVGPGKVEVEPITGAGGAATLDDTVLSYTDLVIATGSEPVAPPVEGLSDVPTWTSAEALTCPDLPRRLVVLGAGPFGCELAQLYAAFGSQVALIEAEPRALPGEAAFAGDLLADALRRAGVDIRLGAAVVKAETLDAGLALTLADGARLEADRVLLGGGRRPRLAGLGLDRLGIRLLPSGHLDLDDRCHVAGAPGGGEGATRVPAGEGQTAGAGGVWAAGDVTGVASYAHMASYQARVVAANILGARRRADYRAIPRAVYTTPSVYSVGVSPARVGAGVELLTAGFDLADTARAAVEDDERGRVELYADAGTSTLAGATAVGPAAEEWMSEATLAVRAGVPLDVLADVVHAFPTYGEAMEHPLRDLAARAAARKE